MSISLQHAFFFFLFAGNNLMQPFSREVKVALFNNHNGNKDLMMQIMKMKWNLDEETAKLGKEKLKSRLYAIILFDYIVEYLFFFSIKVIRKKKIIAYFLYIDAYLRHYCKFSWACTRRISLQNACFGKKKIKFH